MQATPIDDLRSRLVRFNGRYPEISELCGVSYSWVSKFARGERGVRASFATISKLLNALDELDAREKRDGAPVVSSIGGAGHQGGAAG